MKFSGSDNTYAAVGDSEKIVLGENVKIVFTAASSVLDIHIEDCIAHNNKYKQAEISKKHLFRNN